MSQHSAGDALDPAAAQLLAQLRPPGAPRIADMGPRRARLYAAALPSIVGPGPTVGAVADTNAEGVPVRLYTPPVAAEDGVVTEDGVLIYLHGGGWVVGGIDNDDALARRLCVVGARTVISVGYRLAPEHPFPAALEDVATVLRWVAERYRGGTVLVGESAGANLAAATALRSRDGLIPEIRGQVLVCPVLTAEHLSRRDGGLLSVEDLDFFWDQYAPDVDRRVDPLLAPLRCESCAGLAPALIVTAGMDPLADQGRAYAERLRADGVPTSYVHRAELMHGFLPLAEVLEPAADVVMEIGSFLQRLLRPADQVPGR